MKPVFLSLTLLLTACGAPGVEVWGGETSQHRIADMSFTVNHTRSRAEAYRTNFKRRPSRAAVFEGAALAIEQASGCRAVRSSLAGDVALVKADLIC